MMKIPCFKKSFQPDELSFDEGEILYIVDGVSDPNWLKARCGTRVGLVPGNYGTYAIDLKVA